MKKTSGFFELLQEIYNIWVTERPNQLAAALAYYGVFSLAPVIFIAFTIAGIFVNQTALMESIFNRLATVIGPDLAQYIETSVVKLLETTSSSSTLSSLIGSLALLLAAAGLFYQLQFALNSIWKTPPPSNKTRLFIRQQLVSFAIVIGLGILLVAVAFASLLSTWIVSLLHLEGFSTIYAFLGFVLMASITFGFFYKILPNTKIAWRDVWPGALVAAVLMALGIILIGIYLTSGRFSTALEAAGAFAVLLIGIYYLAQIFLLGAIFTRVYARRYGSKKGDAS